MAAYRGSGVTLLEREAVNTLLQEVQLDLAGLTEGGGTNAPQAMQSAYWLVDGAYQSYETTNFQVELILNVSRMFSRYQQMAFRGAPDETLFRQVKSAIDLQMKTNGAIPWPTRNSEAHVQMLIGKELAHLDSASLTWPESYQELDAAEAARRRYNAEEATRAFQTALLLEPTNREAKLCLAACLRRESFRHMEEARNYYRQIIEDPVKDKWTQQAQYALRYSFRWEGSDEKARWFNAVNLQVSNSAAAEFYRQEAEVANKEATLKQGGLQAQAIAEKELLEKMTNAMLGTVYGQLGTEDFVESFGTNQSAAAQRLVELYPELKAKAPTLTPYLLAAVVVKQVDTNAPVVAEFQKLLESYAEEPDEIAKSDKFWSHIWRPVFNWSFDHHFYRMATMVMEDKRRAIALAEHPVWSFDDEDKMSLAYAYMGQHDWQKALGIFETYSNRPVRMGNSGAWGEAFSLVFTSKEASLCRQKLGQGGSSNSVEFDMGKPLLCLCTPSTFIAVDSGLWVGIQGQLVRLSFDLKTNLVVPLPMSPSTRITTISLHSSNVWVGTAGEGLIKYDAGTHQCRQFTVKDGLANDSIASSQVQGDRLWIGYIRGMGFLDLSTQKITTFTPSIAEGVTYNQLASNSVTAGHPPHDGVGAIVTGPSGEIFFQTANSMLNRYRTREQIWDTFPTPQAGAVSGLAADANRLVAGHRFWHSEDTPGPIGVAVMNFKDRQWSAFKAIDGLPATSVTCVALDRNNVWVGGIGYIAVFDADHGTVRRYAYVQTDGYDEGVKRIQIGGGYVWAQFNWHLYRAPLSGL
jgi:streptogramin lyase